MLQQIGKGKIQILNRSEIRVGCKEVKKEGRLITL